MEDFAIHYWNQWPPTPQSTPAINKGIERDAWHRQSIHVHIRGPGALRQDYKPSEIHLSCVGVLRSDIYRRGSRVTCVFFSLFFIFWQFTGVGVMVARPSGEGLLAKYSPVTWSVCGKCKCLGKGYVSACMVTLVLCVCVCVCLDSLPVRHTHYYNLE